jgi:hypothetical protein
VGTTPATEVRPRIQTGRELTKGLITGAFPQKATKAFGEPIGRIAAKRRKNRKKLKADPTSKSNPISIRPFDVRQKTDPRACRPTTSGSRQLSKI